MYAVCENNKWKIKKNLRIQIACGTKDGGHLKTVRDFHQHLVGLGIDHTYIELEGLKHQLTRMMSLLRPVWFDYHFRSLGHEVGGEKR